MNKNLKKKWWKKFCNLREEEVACVLASGKLFIANWGQVDVKCVILK